VLSREDGPFDMSDRRILNREIHAGSPSLARTTIGVARATEGRPVHTAQARARLWNATMGPPGGGGLERFFDADVAGDVKVSAAEPDVRVGRGSAFSSDQPGERYTPRRRMSGLS
jgi:hypothetical protein